MQDDFRSAVDRKPKVIEPISQPSSMSLDIDTAGPTPVTSGAVISPAEESTESTPGSEISRTDTTDEKGKRFRISWPPSKREWLIIVTMLVLLIAAGGAVYSLTHRGVKPLANHAAKKVTPKPKAPLTVPSKLSGLPVDPSVNQRPVTGVMIENSLDARPQSGLEQAGVVFEAIAEGGVTRFFAVFQDTQPDYIGPVRSARPYYIQWCLSFDCSYAHVGGSPDGLADIKSWGVKDLDQFANSGAYHRISSRYAPHNVYTSIAELNSLENSKGFGISNFTGFSRKADKAYKAPVAAVAGKPAPKDQETRAAANSIDFTLSGYYYDPHFDYDAASNSYKRSEAGQPHMEQRQDSSQVQITPKVVIGMVVPLSQGALDSSGAYYSNYQAVGTGTALIFQDGTVVTAHWSKPDVKSSLSFTDDTGKPLNLNAGQTWITAITGTNKASYK